MKKIGLFITAYNEEEMLGRCLDSIISQDEFKQIDIIILFDCGTKKTKEIANIYCKKYNNIFLHENSANKGVAFTRAQSKKYFTNYEYITYMDADDIISDNALSFYFNLIDQYSNVDIFYNSLVKMFEIVNFKSVIEPDKFIFTKASDLLYTFNNALHLYVFKVKAIEKFDFDINVRYDDLDYKCNFIDSKLNLCITNTEVIGYYVNPNGQTRGEKSEEVFNQIKLTMQKYEEKLDDVHMAYFQTKHYQKNIFSRNYIKDHYATWHMTRQFMQEKETFYQNEKAYFQINNNIELMLNDYRISIEKEKDLEIRKLKEQIRVKNEKIKNYENLLVVRLQRKLRKLKGDK